MRQMVPELKFQAVLDISFSRAGNNLSIDINIVETIISSRLESPYVQGPNQYDDLVGTPETQ
jgi:hypothetical protein